MTFVPNLRNLVRSSQEIHEPEIGEVQGQIPSWLKGSYIRNGPGKWDLGSDFYMNHVFDGFAILTKFVIENGQVSLRTKYLASEDYVRAVKVGRPLHLGFGTKSFPDPNKSLFSRFVSNIVPQETSDNCCTGIYSIGNAVFTGVDGTYFYQVDPVTLKTGDKLDGNKLFGLNVVSPKPVTDTLTGDVFNVGSFVSPSGVKHGIVQIPSDLPTAKEALKKSKLVASWPSRWSASCHYTHSFGLTKNYYIVVDQPFMAGLTSIAANVLKGKPMIELFEWHGREKNRFFIVDRGTGKPLRTEYFSEESFFFYHIINCYEDNNHIIVDMIAYKDTKNFQSMFIERLRQNVMEDTPSGQVRRYVFPILEDISKAVDDGRNLNDLENCKATAVRKGNQIILSPHVVAEERGVEAPAINRMKLGKKYKYFYGNASFHLDFINKLGKFNVDTGERLLWKGNEFEHPGEPVYVQDPSRSGEDDGIILSAVTVVNEEPSYLLILDAKTFEEIARVEFSTQIPLGVDGIFVSK